MKNLIFALSLLLAFLTLNAQPNQPDQKARLDSLYAIWQDKTLADTTRAIAFKDFIWSGFINSETDTALNMAEGLIEFGIEKNNPRAQAYGFNILGTIMTQRGDYTKSLEYYIHCLKIMEQIGYQKGIAQSHYNIGFMYDNQGDYPKALEYYTHALKIYEQIGSQSNIADSYRNIASIYLYQGDYPKAVKYLSQSLKSSKLNGDQYEIADCLIGLGTSFYRLGDYVKALNNYSKSLKIFEEIGDQKGIAVSINNIGLIYWKQDDLSKALEYYNKSLKIDKEIDDQPGIAASLSNIGLIYKDQDDFSKALDYFNQSLKIYEQLGDQSGVSNTFSKIGLIYEDQSDYAKALEYINQSLSIKKQLGDQHGVAGDLINSGIIYRKQGDFKKAVDYGIRGYELAVKIGILGYQKNGSFCLYKTYKAMGNGFKALEYHELANALEDSLNAEETAKKLQQMEFAKQVLQDSIAQVEKDRIVQAAHQEEVRKKNKTRNFIIGVALFFILASGGFYSRWRYVRKSKATLQVEKDRSENLLLNILPAEIAEELKQNGRAEARDFDMVTIIFTDFKGFTEASAKLSAQDLVSEINSCFEAFDGIMAKFGVEKIKTIGDAYMAAGGLPVPTNDSVKNTVLAALEMQSFITSRKAKNDDAGLPAFEMRVGIHTGPVVAGIVGVKKFQYDIWGDTVNTASRMESSGEVGKVNISQATYQLLTDNEPPALSLSKGSAEFTFEKRGKIEAKGKGEMEMWFVSLNKTQFPYL
ncbi:MAG: tetratricopeptide repeat protein [Bacteroidales bacterium]|nr:tetratricopeptide repeat protein [Bacteroidales bacterium]MCF8455291.1 tetratricopeptide repeat protein [Bacteroidales bacterium]